MEKAVAALLLCFVMMSSGIDTKMWSHTEDIDIYESVSVSSKYFVAGTGYNYVGHSKVQVYDSMYSVAGVF